MCSFRLLMDLYNTVISDSWNVWKGVVRCNSSRCVSFGRCGDDCGIVVDISMHQTLLLLHSCIVESLLGLNVYTTEIYLTSFNRSNKSLTNMQC